MRKVPGQESAAPVQPSIFTGMSVIHTEKALPGTVKHLIRDGRSLVLDFKPDTMIR